MTDYWFKQGAEPLYPDLLWSRPENKRQAGKLLIVGGNKFGFAAVGVAYAAAQAAGIGSVRVLLPDALTRTVSKLLPEAEFAVSTPSGSLSRQALAPLIELAGWADGVLLAGDFGRNSETAILLERFLAEHKGSATLQQDALDYFWQAGSSLLNRHQTNLVINLGKLQKLAKNNWPATPVLHSMTLKDLADWLVERTSQDKISITTKHADNYLVALNGQVVSQLAKESQNWQTELGAFVAVWRLQQPKNDFAALASGLYQYAT